MAAQGESVEDRMAIRGQAVKSITEQSGDMSCSYYNEPQHESFSHKPNYKGKDGKGSLESVQNNEDMYRAGNEHNRP